MAVTQEKRTIMYSVDGSGNVVVHRFPFDAGDKLGMGKLKKFLDRGFTFQDPRGDGVGVPQVIVTDEVRVGKPLSVEDFEKDEEIKKLREQVEELMEAVKGKVDIPLEEIKVSEAEIRYEKQEWTPLPCPECGKLCKSGLGVEAHMRKHRRERGELGPYKKGKGRGK